jgi:ribosomal protein S18 acetylase RimI-like enzyme
MILKKYKFAQIFLDEKNKKLQEVIFILDLAVDRKLLELKIPLHNSLKTIKAANVSFSHFEKGIDEKRRLIIQNSIFHDTKWHRDSSVKDILYEEEQDYFTEDGCIFLEYDGKTVGYSQIILEKNHDIKPCIVNFGISKNFRGLGLSKLLLNYTLNAVKHKGFAEAYINVDASNYKAYNLYKKTGFEKTNSFSSFLYRYK